MLGREPNTYVLALGKYSEDLAGGVGLHLLISDLFQETEFIRPSIWTTLPKRHMLRKGHANLIKCDLSPHQ